MLATTITTSVAFVITAATSVIPVDVIVITTATTGRFIAVKGLSLGDIFVRLWRSE